MKEWLFPLTKEMYDLVESGKKKVEGRVSDPSNPEKNYLVMDEGDILLFRCLETRREMKKRVTGKKKYPSVEKCLEEEGLEKMLPGVKTIEEGVAIYNGFLGYKERIKIFGIYAIYFEKF